MLPAVRAPSLLLVFLVGCGTPSGRPADAGPTYCAQKVGSVASCDASGATGPVAQCGPQFPVCTPPSQSGGGAWACCASSTLGGGVEQTVCTFPGSTDASCPCAGCGDAGQ